jgi:hypothetical protein
MMSAVRLTGLFALHRIARCKAIPIGEQDLNTPTAVHPSFSILENVQQCSIDEIGEESSEETPLEWVPA